ncbi:MAG: two-component system response regulator [Balneola sp.]|jgi:two-component system chemotaxis response regulator CheY|nr:two-component system response regulator [Balneola sp.]MBE79145.1 two-component system response regulator [Balneola sp.]|tara:strand:- start:1502 stop:1882 length:381 start_codon:yes stop_codon:yes gene_type:complete
MAINILIVDDSAVMRSMIKKTIMNTGVEIGEVHEASNGKEGLEVVEDNWLDLLFIDVNMPVMDGMEMLDHIRKNPITMDMPVLIVSTESNNERIKIIDQQYAGFVHKPFTPEVLREKILSVLAVAH